MCFVPSTWFWTINGLNLSFDLNHTHFLKCVSEAMEGGTVRIPFSPRMLQGPNGIRAEEEGDFSREEEEGGGGGG